MSTTTADVKTSDDTLEIEIKTEGKTRKPRRVVDRDTVAKDFEELITLLEKEVATLQTANKGAKPHTRTGIKFLRTVKKRVTTLSKDTKRAFNTKPKTKRSKNSQSGFMKPVAISDELAKFAGWPTGCLKSRVDATKFLCDYIKKNNLQNPADKRQILPDAALQALLKFNPTTEPKPLTYFRIQSCIQPHFPESAKKAAANAAALQAQVAAQIAAVQATVVQPVVVGQPVMVSA
jgi:chromatin remodeling complex protein RSC6